jgi:hypothetical protein
MYSWSSWARPTHQTKVPSRFLREGSWGSIRKYALRHEVGDYRKHNGGQCLCAKKRKVRILLQQIEQGEIGHENERNQTKVLAYLSVNSLRIFVPEGPELLDGEIAAVIYHRPDYRRLYVPQMESLRENIERNVIQRYADASPTKKAQNLQQTLLNRHYPSLAFGEQ